MCPFPANFTRPKASTITNESETVDFTATDNGAGVIEIRVFLDNLTINPQAIVDLSSPSVTWAAAGGTITGAAESSPGAGDGSFSNVRVGDVITSTSGTDFANTQTVTLVAADGSTVDFLPVADGNADSGQGGSTLTFTPGDIDSTLYIMRLTHTFPGSSVSMVPTVAVFDGSLVEEGSTADNSDDVTYADGTEVNLNEAGMPTINLNGYLNNARIAQTN